VSINKNDQKEKICKNKNDQKEKICKNKNDQKDKNCKNKNDKEEINLKNENITLIHTDNSTDKRYRSDKITRILSQPPIQEIMITTTIDHDNLQDALTIPGVVDSGTGFSYLIIPEDYELDIACQLDDDEIEIEFADGSASKVSEFIKVSMTLHSSDGKYTVSERGIKLYILKSKRMEVLLGRDLIHRFNINILAATKVTIGGYTMNIHKQPRLHVNDKIQHIRQFVHVGRIRSMPRSLLEDCLIQETVDSEDDALTELEVQHLISSASGEIVNSGEGDIEITIGATEPDAPAGRLEISIPWRSHERPPNGFRQAWCRDQIIQKRLTASIHEAYDKAISQMVNTEVVTRVDPKGSIAKHFIPSRPVVDLERNTKVRICLDARTINEYTYEGRVSSDDILQCLWKFRIPKFVALYDLEKAFWQIKFNHNDVGWFSTVTNGVPITFMRMCFGANFSPAGLEYGIRKIYKIAKERIINNTDRNPDEPQRPSLAELQVHNYVDDICHTGNTPQSVSNAAVWMQWLFKQYGFPSAKEFSNCHELEPGSTQSYLGYKWNLPSDEIEVKIPKFPAIPAEFKVVDCVKTVATFYDPLGLDLKRQLGGRLIVRQAFQEHHGVPSKFIWKQIITSNNTKEMLNKWIDNTPTKPVTVPRQIDNEHLHVFADASQECWVYEVRDSNFNLIFSRGGLTNPKSTIPRNELIALYEAVISSQKFLKIFYPKSLTFYTDSECTIHRLRGKTKLPKFEFNRIQAMLPLLQELVQKYNCQIIHIPGELNPADYATRPHQAGGRPDILIDVIHAYSKYPETTRFPSSREDLDTIQKDYIQLMKLRNRATAGAAAQLEQEPSVNLTGRLKQSQQKYNIELNEYLTIDQDDIIRRDDRAVVPHQDEELIKHIISKAHGKIHNGIGSTTRIIKESFQWRGMTNDVKKFVNNCETCQVAKAKHSIRATAGAALQLENVEAIPVGAIIGIDIATIESPSIDNASCILTLTCLLTKWIRSTTLITQNAEEVVEALERVCYKTIFPFVLVMDNASIFHSKKMRRCVIRHNMRTCFLPPHASPYAGWIERSHQSILNALRVLVRTNPGKAWDELLPEATYLVNTKPYDGADSDICPLDLVYANSKVQRELTQDEPDEKLLEVANLLHLYKPSSSSMDEYSNKQLHRKKKLLKQYEYLFNKNRREIKKRLNGRYRDKTDACLPGASVRVYRPQLSKVKARWSSPCIVLHAPTDSTRIIKKPDGTESLEWVGNLSEIPLPPECSVPEA